MGTFLEATDVTREGTGYAATIDPDWFIWGPFGGYLAAIAMRAMATRSRHSRPVTFGCQYLNVGAAGPVEIEIATRKSSRRAESLAVSITQRGKPLIEAQSWITAMNLDGLDYHHASMPEVGAPTTIPLFEAHEDSIEALSPIWQHMERRPRDRLDNPSRTPGKPECVTWVRLLEPMPGDDPVLKAAQAIMWMDMTWDAVLHAHEWPISHVAPNLDLTVQFQDNLFAADVMNADWMLLVVKSPTAGNGLLGAQGTLWSETGKLVAVSASQCICRPNPHFAEQLEKARRRQ